MNTLARKLRMGGGILGAYTALGGLLTLIGWFANLPRLTDWQDNGISMMPNAAVCALCAGVALLLHLWLGSRRVASVLGAVVAFIGAATLMQHFTGVNLGIDTLLMNPQWGQRGTILPGRMGPPGATSWAIIGAALVLIAGGAKMQRAAVGFASLALGISLLSLVGYLFGAQLLFTLPKLTVIALQTATMIFAMGLGIIMALPDRQPMKTLVADTTAGLLARRALPLILGFPLIIGLLRVRGQEAGLFDTAFGTALRTLVEVVFLVALLWWTLGTVAAKESALRREQQRTAQVLESITDGFHVVDAAGRFTFFNDAARKMFAAQGQDTEALLGKHIIEDVFPKAREVPSFRAHQRTLTERVPTEAENFYAPWKQWFVVRHYPAADGGVATFFQDITARKQAEEALRDSQARFEIVKDGAQVGFWFCDLPFDKLIWDSRVKEHFWLASDAEVTIGTFFDRLHPDDREPTRQAIAASNANHTRYDVEYRTVAPDGREKWIRAMGRTFYDAQNVPVRFDGVTLDITQRKRDEDALRESEARKAAILNSSLDAIVSMDAGGLVVEWNPAAEKMFGRPAAEVIGRPLADLIIPERLRAAHNRGLAHYLATGEGPVLNKRIEMPALRADGGEFPIELSITRVAGLEPPRFSGFIRDITERKQAEEVVRESKARLETALEAAQAAARAKDQFLGNLSHELRTPLTPVLLTISMLLEEETLSPFMRESLEMIDRNIEIEAQMVNDLLDLTRIGSNKLELSLRDCDLHEVVRRALEVCAGSAASKSVRTALHFSPAPLRVRGDATRLQQVFWNLIQNAVKFTPAGGGITLTSSIQDGRCVVEVADTGRGIEADLLGRIFEPFEQGDEKTKETLQGLGLGLAIARRIVQAHGGALTVRSEGRNQGSTFTVALPVAPEAGPS